MNAQCGEAVVEEFLREGRRPSAIFCANDMLALGALRSLLAARIRVPEDVSVVGYDDIAFASLAHVPLTSIRQPMYELGRAAAELLLAEIDEGERHEHRNVLFKPELVVRESTSESSS
jgi:LacI family transcriptional regulator